MYFEVLAPSIGVGLVFWLAIRSIFRADRSERSTESEVRQRLEKQRTTPDDNHTDNAERGHN